MYILIKTKIENLLKKRGNSKMEILSLGFI